MGSTSFGLVIFGIAVLVIGCLLGVGVLVDVINYRDLQRRLREERRRQEETGRRWV